jgi:exosortase
MKNTSIDIAAILKKYSAELIIASLFLLTYVPTFIWLWDRWFARDSYYSHGILVPFVSAFLIWQKRDELAVIPKTPSKWGLPILYTGVALHLISALLRVYFSSGFSLLIVLIGLVLHLYGDKVFRKIWFPILFIIFMLPTPLVIITWASFKLKLFAAQISAFLLNKMGIMAIREGSMIYMRESYVVVDDVCSGLRSLISLTALGSLFAYMFKGPVWKKTLLFLSTIPIAVITNVFRVIILASVSEIWGAKYAEGFLHDATGFMVFVLAFILLIAVVNLLEDKNDEVK